MAQHPAEIDADRVSRAHLERGRLRPQHRRRLAVLRGREGCLRRDACTVRQCAADVEAGGLVAHYEAG